MHSYMTKKNILIMSVIIAVVLMIYGVSYLYAIKPVQEESNALEQELSLYETQYEKITSDTAGASVDEELENVAGQVPAHKNPDDLLIDLQKIAEDTNVGISYIESRESGIASEAEEQSDSGEETDILTHHTYAIDANAENLAEINQFVDKMTNHKRLMIIGTLNISQANDSVNLSVTFKVFSSE